MYKLFILLFTALPGEDPMHVTHTITVESPHVYTSESKCLEAAGALGFRTHPGLPEASADFRCLEVANIDNKIVLDEDTI